MFFNMSVMLLLHDVTSQDVLWKCKHWHQLFLMSNFVSLFVNVAFLIYLRLQSIVSNDVSTHGSSLDACSKCFSMMISTNHSSISVVALLRVSNFKSSLLLSSMLPAGAI